METVANFPVALRLAELESAMALYVERIEQNPQGKDAWLERYAAAHDEWLQLKTTP
jgi:hypothetical protein